MKMIRVSSSTLKAVGYNQISQTLVTKFRFGTYEYYDVPKHIYENLMSSNSKEKYYSENIKWNFCYEKIR